MQAQGNGGSDGSTDMIVIIIAIFGVIALIWWQLPRLIDFTRFFDLMILRGWAFLLPLGLGDHYRLLADQYASIPQEHLTLRHKGVAGRYAWYPFMIGFAFFLVKRGIEIRRPRVKQQFRIMDKAHMDMLYAERKADPKEREPWTINRWFVYYKLRDLPWGHPKWEATAWKVLSLQLGKPNPDPNLDDEEILEQADPLILEFARLIKMKDPEKATVATVRAHGYPSTSICRLLSVAREANGFIAINKFKNSLFQSATTIPWWWALNALDRQTVHIEGLGVLSHYYREISYKERLTTPDMEWAFQGLNMAREYRVQNHYGDLTNLPEESPPAVKEKEQKNT